MRALVISDTHFGAWTGRDILREPENLALLAPHLDGLDEVILLGDLFDLLFGRIEEAFRAAEPLLGLLREKLQGKRVVFLAGNHDYHVIVREHEGTRETQLATGKSGTELEQEVLSHLFFRRFLAKQLEGVELLMRYPTYKFGRVLCTHGHHLDPHARRTGSTGSKILGRLLWSIALGGGGEPRTLEQYEAVTTLLTEELFTLAQLPHGTATQQNVYATAQRLAKAMRVAESPVRALQHLVSRTRVRRDESQPVAAAPAVVSNYERARAEEGEVQAQTPRAAVEAATYSLVRRVRPNDPREHALRAFDKAVHTLGWNTEAQQIVFAHTHQPVADARLPGGKVSYWNSGSWIYEPDLASLESYVRYLRCAWPGSVVVLDTDEPAPRLLELRRHLNPLNQR
jgi:UDP-2,3-diacylglucosamine pyrophosphatase LpxH